MASLTPQQKQALMAELPGLKRFGLSLTGNPADADDLLQLTVERLLERGMPEDAHPAKWAYRVCRNLWIDEIRAREVRSRHQQSEQAADTLQHITPGGEDNAQLQEVAKAMAELAEEQRAALTLVAVEGCSYAEAAEILDVPIGTIMSRVARARQALAEKIGWGKDAL
jgi:RNA polymerase sigma-70 factor (ECF subfamily)